jgi:hypothetical protein
MRGTIPLFLPAGIAVVISNIGAMTASAADEQVSTPA